MGELLMEAKGLKKVFGDFVANDGVDLKVEKGKIYALAGENGAGKSTLMKMLYGIYKIDGGELLIDGKKMEKYSPAIAREKGFGMVFQDFRLVPAFTALENVFLTLTELGMYFDKKALRKKMIEVSNKYDLGVSPDEYVWRMDLGQRQHVEILKVLLSENTRILIFDEPTSVLAPNEIEAFLDLLLTFKEAGYAIILITHKIQEIVRVADVVHILRKGKMVHTFFREDGLNKDDIVSQMIGSNDEKLSSVQAVYDGTGRVVKEYPEKLISCSHMTIKDDYGRTIINNASFSISPGMILGVAGISGNGQRELTEVLYGIRKLESGKIRFKTKDITNSSIAERIDMGFRILSEDPIRDNLVPEYTVLHHMAISGFDYKKKMGNIDWKDVQRQMDECEDIKNLNVPGTYKVAEKLSGGNIQRMVFARAVIGNPQVLIVSYPSRGLDIATVSAVHDTLKQLRDAGAAILFISEDLNELFTLSDRLIVLSENTVNGPYTPADYDSDKIGTIMLKGALE